LQERSSEWHHQANVRGTDRRALQQSEECSAPNNIGEKSWKTLTRRVKSPNGTSRSLEEKKLFILAICATLRRHFKAVEEEEIDPLKMSWTWIEKDAVEDFNPCRSYVTKIRCMFVADGDVAIFGELEARGGAVDNYSNEKQQTVPGYVLIYMASCIDEVHAKGMSVTNCNLLQNWLQDNHSISISHRTVQRKLCALGLSWSKIIPRKKKTLNYYGYKAIQDFLILHNLVYKSILSGDLDYVYVFTDKSYVRQSHVMAHSYLPKDDKTIERKSGEVIMLHAILTTDGPLCATDENWRPINNLAWKGNACHQHLKRMENYPVQPCGPPNLILATIMII
jgi:hypothetical protein